MEAGTLGRAGVRTHGHMESRGVTTVDDPGQSFLLLISFYIKQVLTCCIATRSQYAFAFCLKEALDPYMYDPVVVVT